MTDRQTDRQAGRQTDNTRQIKIDKDINENGGLLLDLNQEITTTNLE